MLKNKNFQACIGNKLDECGEFDSEYGNCQTLRSLWINRYKNDEILHVKHNDEITQVKVESVRNIVLHSY